jgi:hypothetical protein
MCQEMFEYDFNYEKFLKDETKTNKIKSQFEDLLKNKLNLKKYFSKENLESVSKEISMEYFFKGEESQFSNQDNMDKYKSCKVLKSGIDINCDNLKYKLCENILSYEKGICLKKIIEENYTEDKRINENENENKNKNKNKNRNDLNETDKIENLEKNVEGNFDINNNVINSLIKKNIESNIDMSSNLINNGKQKQKFSKGNNENSIDVEKNYKNSSKINLILIY